MRYALCLLALAQVARADGEDETPSKKQALLDEKASRPQLRRVYPPTDPAVQPVSLVNVWTKEVLPVDPAKPPSAPLFDRFLRCHFTNQSTLMDPRLLAFPLAAAARFKSSVVEVVSGYRAPKYNLMLRKKGHEVGRDSQHPMGHAVDFRLPGLPTRTLLLFVRSLRRGGVGFYPESAFVHADVGPIRYWKGH